MKYIDKNESELNYLKERCLIFYDYLYEKYKNQPNLIGFANILKNAREGIEKEYKKGNLIGLREANNDFTNQLKEMPIEDMIELGRILKRKLGEDINQIENMRLCAIKKIKKKGKISTLEEYELIQKRVDDIYNDPDNIEEVEQLNQLLVNFH